MSRNNILCCDRLWPNERFCVAMGNFRLRHSWLGREDFLSRQSILGHDRVGQGKERLCRDTAILCHDRVGQNREKFMTDRGFLGHDRADHDREEAMRAR